jgi:hypothetical protein
VPGRDTPHGSDVGPGTGEGAGSSAPGDTGGGSESIHEQRQPRWDEVEKDPETKHLMYQMMATEGGGRATVEALFNRVAMIRKKIPGYTIKDELHSPFYGPIKRGEAQRTPISAAAAARYQSQINDVVGGSNLIQGRTDQGMPGDPNDTGPGRVHPPGASRSEIYNFWKGSRGRAQFSWADSQKFAEEQNQRAALDANRRTVDATSKQQVEVNGSGTLTANINAPKGTTATMEGEGLFKNTIVNRQTQMEPAAGGPPQPKIMGHY